MTNKIAISYFWLNLVAVGIFVADRIFKIYFLKNPAISFGGDFFYGILKFNYAENYGIAFGLPASPVIIIFLTIVVSLVLIFELIQSYRNHNLILILGLTFIFFGAASNLIDRLKNGFVVDYIDLKYFTVFNLADSLITIGVVVLLWFLVKEHKRLDKNKSLV